MASDQFGNYQAGLQDAGQTLPDASGSGTQEVLQYVSDPNTEGIVPADQTKEALVYQQDGQGPILTWNTTTHVWQ